MKRTKWLTITAVAIVIMLSTLALASCAGNNGNGTTSTPTKLTAPVVTLTGDKATWSANPDADRFEISIDGNLSYVENSVTEKTLADGQTFKVRAIGDGTNYTNSDWSNSVTYVKPISKYTITWKNGDTVLETDENVVYGSTPSYNGAIPTKTSTAQYTYTFSGWSPQISEVTQSVTYQAQFSENIRFYTVTFYSEDGSTVLDTVTVQYGSNAVYSKSTPVKNATVGHTYVFEKWVTEQGGAVADDLTNVVANRSVYASFKGVSRTVTVYIVPNNTDYGSVSVSVLDNIPYGAEIAITGNTVTVNGQSITANAKTATPQYTYTFANWTADATVGNDTTIIANFSRSVNSYTVTWKNGDTVLETDENVAYGTTPVYNGAVPEKESDNFVYTFSGWFPAISSVSGDITYFAQFVNAENNHVVIFYDDDGVTELGRAVVGHGETAIYPNALPTKESTVEFTYTFEKWVTTKNGTTEAIFTNITEDKSVYAKYSTTARTYLVTFCDYGGNVLSQLEVAYGNSVENQVPVLPERESCYRFDGWKIGSLDEFADLTNITCDLELRASYTKLYLVQFWDNDDTILPINYCEDCNDAYNRSELNDGNCPRCNKPIQEIYDQWIEYGESAIAPQDPTRDGYRFTGWNTVFSNVVHDLTVKAEYIRQYKVTFLDYDKTVLKEVMVDAGSTAVAPSNPSKEGYTFDGWDKVFANVSSDLTVTATYKVKTYTVKFVMPDGAIIGEAQSVEHGFSAIAPEYPEFCLEGSGDYTEVYGFTRWNKSFNNVTEDLIIEAVYESDYTKPVIIIEYSQERNGDAKLYIYNHESIKLNAIEFTINYSTIVGNISINSATVNSASPLWVEDSDGNNNNQYVINNNESTFTFAWSDANGKQFDWCSKVVTFNFSTDGAVVGEETFRIDGCSAIVSDSNGENLEKITPVVVYR